jgi:hypothetical protein
VAYITVFGPISGAHFNPAVSLVERLHGRLGTTDLVAYVAAQLIGGVVGVLVAHAMFGLPIFQQSLHVRTGVGQWIAEGVATFGLVTVILGSAMRSPGANAHAGRALHRRRVLVHRIDLVREPCRDPGAIADRHVSRASGRSTCRASRSRRLQARSSPQSCGADLRGRAR